MGDRAVRAARDDVIDPVELASALIRADSVTPACGPVFDILEAALVPLGSQV